MEKIDFFGGTHGHFLEFMINVFVYQLDYQDDDIFNKNGACHARKQYYHPQIVCDHYSHNKQTLDSNDLVIEIHCDDNDMLPAIINSLVRAGDQVMDLTDLETSTINKLSRFPKADFLIKDLINDHGIKDHYPRSVLRNYFYTKFDCPKYGLDMVNSFTHIGLKHHFPFSAFYDLEKFYIELNRCAFFLNLDFCPTQRTAELWRQFIKVNQGFHSQQRCYQALKSILSGESMSLSDFNIVEEAWILYKISRIFRCYDHPLLSADQFITDTKEISQIIYEWKKGDLYKSP